MNSSIWILLVTLALANALQLKVGPQTFNDTSSSTSKPQQSQKRYATKEVILYLTPSQIRSLQTGEGIITRKAVPKSNPENEEQREYIQEPSLVPSLEDDYIQQQISQFSFDQEQRVPPVEEQVVEAEKPSTPQIDYAQPQTTTTSTENPFLPQVSHTYVNFYPSLHIQESKPSLYLQQENKEPEQLQQEKEEVKPLPNSENKLRLVPYEQSPVHNEAEAQHILELSEQLHRLLDHNRAQLKKIPSQSSNTQPTEASQGSQSNEEQQSESLYSQYAARYGNQKYVDELEKLLKERHELDRQNALYRAEAIAKSAPLVIHKEVKITKNLPVHVVKHVKVPVPTPVLIPVPEPYEVKVPKPYPVPLEILRHVPVPVVKTEKIEVDRPLPVEVEKLVPVPVTKKVYVNVDRPYFVDRVVPVEIKKEVPVEIPLRKAEKLTILRHLWH